MQRRGLLTTGVVAGLLALIGCGPKPEPEKPPVKPAPPKPVVKTPEPEPELPPVDVPDTARVRLETSMGDIVLELNGKAAPITTANFLRYVEAGKLDGATFWRAMKSHNGGFVQASTSGHRFPPIAHEPTSQTGLSHTNGTISMARYAVGTASHEFTLSVGDMTYMDAGRDPEGDNQGYAAFGKVVSGMNVVRRILSGKIAKSTAPGGWDGQMLEAPVTIISGRRIDG